MSKFILFIHVTFICVFVSVSCHTGDEFSGSYSISGRITYKLPGYSSQGLAGVTVTLKSTDSSSTTYTDASGMYNFSGFANGFYSIIPIKIGWSFGTLGVLLDRNATNQDFEVTGTVSGFSIDPWGFVWDSENRPAKTYAEAVQICKDLDGRLPTPTEIYRNRYSTGKCTIANANDTTNWLWTCIQWDHTPYQAVGKLGNGDIDAGTPSNSHSFRCVWPDNDPGYFSGTNVNVDISKNEKPFEYKINGLTYLIDTTDRPPDVNYNIAVREAMFYHAFIPSLAGFTAAIKSNLQNGSNNWVWTSDYTSYGGNLYTELVKWTATASSFPATYSDSISYAMLHALYSFRCIGLNYKPELHPASSVKKGNPWFSEKCILTSIDSDLGGTSGSKHLDAIIDCFDDGGHLPTAQEMMQLIISGLPNGSNKYLWTTDYIYSDQVALAIWNGICPQYSGYYSTYGSWAGHSTQLYWYRPIYYPINKAYNGPDPLNETTCPEGLFTYTKDLGNGNIIKIWIDAADRDAKTFAGAVKDCYDSGGQLATRRDLVELLHQGLANGSNEWIWTADIADAGSAHVIKWTGTNRSFGDQDNGTDATELSTALVNTKGYRCIWTNEIRIP